MLMSLSICRKATKYELDPQLWRSRRMPNNAINTDGKLARAFGAHSFAAGYGER
jgi:hypothetical protein